MSADTPDRDDAFAASIAAMIGKLAGRPDRLRARLNGMALDGTLHRAMRGSSGVPSGLAPFMVLPAPEPERRIRARMAELILRLCASTGSITREQLVGGGFTEAEITRHFHAAKRIAGVTRMVA
jgi:hypothetical protein